MTIPPRVQRQRAEAAAALAASGETPQQLADDLARGRRMSRIVAGTSGRKQPEDDEDEDMEGRRTLRDVEMSNGGPGVFRFDWKEHRLLKNEDWKFVRGDGPCHAL